MTGVTVRLPQLSVAVTAPVRSGTISSQLPLRNRVRSDAQRVTTGSVLSSPVRITSRVTIFPLPSSTLIVTVWVIPSPEGRAVVAAMLWVTVTLPQLSVAVTSPVRSGTISSQLPLRNRVRSEGQRVTTGSVLSSPVRITSRVTIFPLPSSTLIVTVWVIPSPEGRAVVAAMLWVTVTLPQLSVAVTSPVRSGTISSQLPLRNRVRSEGQRVTTGSVLSSPVRITSRVTIFPLPSSTLIVTVWVIPSPEGRAVVAAMLWVTVTLPQLSVAVTSPVRSGTISSQLPLRNRVRSEGQRVTTGSVLSSPVRITSRVTIFPLPSSTLIVTVWVIPSPEGRAVVAAMLWVTVTLPQLSVAVT